MKFVASSLLVLLALSSVEAFVIPPRSIWMGKLSTRNYRVHPIRRDPAFRHLNDLTSSGGTQKREAAFKNLDDLTIDKGSQRRQAQQEQKGGGGGLTIGGLTLGGPSGGITGNGLQLGGNRQGNGQQQQQQQNGQESRNGTASVIEQIFGPQGGNTPAKEETAPAKEETAPAKEETTPAKEETAPAKEETAPAKEETAPQCGISPTKGTSAGAGTENQPGRAEGEAARLEAQQETQAAQGEKSNGVKATEESEQFSEEAGITLDQSGNARNLGGNLGITKGSDGSTSVGGENGINVAANGEATVAGNE